MQKNNLFRQTLAFTLSLFVFIHSAYPQPAAKSADPISTSGAVNLGENKGVSAASEGTVRPVINPYDVSIPEEFGRIDRVFQGAENGPLVVHVQDAHANYEGQKNIKNILTHLEKEYGVNLVQVEGAISNKLNPAVFATSWHQEGNLKLADFMMRQGRLSGPEAFAMEFPDKVSLYGIEDSLLYVENLKTFRKVYSYQEDITQYIAAMRALAKDLRVKLLNEELLDLTRQIEAYSQEKIELLDYLLYLNKLAEKYELASLNNLAELVRFPNLVRIMRLHELEKQFSAEDLEKEAEKVKEVFLTKPLDEKEKAIIEKLSVQKKGMKPRDYFRRITDLAEKHGIKLMNYPNLRVFAEFSILQDEIDHRGVFTEVSNLEKILQKKLFKSKAEQFLIDILKAIELLDQYFKLELSREKLGFVMRRFEKIKPTLVEQRLNYMAQQIGVKPSEYKGKTVELDQLMTEVEYFYRVVLERDRHFFDNVMARLEESKADRTVFVSGGFHTDGVMNFLEKKNVSYIVIIPKIDIEQGNENYLKVMLEGDNGVGSVFAGNFALIAAMTTVTEAANFPGTAANLRSAHDISLLGPAISVQLDGLAGKPLNREALNAAAAKISQQGIFNITVQEAGYDEDKDLTVITLQLTTGIPVSATMTVRITIRGDSFQVSSSGVKTLSETATPGLTRVSNFPYYASTQANTRDSLLALNEPGASISVDSRSEAVESEGVGPSLNGAFSVFGSKIPEPRFSRDALSVLSGPHRPYANELTRVGLLTAAALGVEPMRAVTNIAQITTGKTALPNRARAFLMSLLPDLAAEDFNKPALTFSVLPRGEAEDTTRTYQQLLSIVNRAQTSDNLHQTVYVSGAQDEFAEIILLAETLGVDNRINLVFVDGDDDDLMVFVNKQMVQPKIVAEAYSALQDANPELNLEDAKPTTFQTDATLKDKVGIAFEVPTGNDALMRKLNDIFPGSIAVESISMDVLGANRYQAGQEVENETLYMLAGYLGDHDKLVEQLGRVLQSKTVSPNGYAFNPKELPGILDSLTDELAAEMAALISA